MYRVSPVTYFVNTMAAVNLAGADITCSSEEVVTIPLPSMQDCQTFLGVYARIAGARLLDPSSTVDCKLCPIATTDGLLASLNIFYSGRWKSFAISLAFPVSNLIGTMVLYRTLKAKKGTEQGLTHRISPHQVE
jgi:ABC-type multidrug transport system permease subunit